MTESEWLTSADPAAMLRLLIDSADYHGKVVVPVGNIGRKLRLWCAAMADLSYEVGSHVHHRYRHWREGKPDPAPYVDDMDNVLHLAVIWSRSHLPHECMPAQRAALLRDIFGNPFRTPMLIWREGNPYSLAGPIVVYPKPIKQGVCLVTGEATYERCNWLRWNNGTVPRMAQAIYDDRRWGDMPVLADALLDAGCEDEELIRHCRGEERCDCDSSYPGHRHRHGDHGPGYYPCGTCNDPDGRETPGWRPLRSSHARGCWALDLLLGKE